MTTITKHAEITKTPTAPSEAEQVLRDAAFVLRMIRKVKVELLAERPQTARVAASRMSDMAAGLGV